jgi:hypothetical protein
MTTTQLFDPLNSQKGSWALVSGQLAEVFPMKDGAMKIRKFTKHTFRLIMDVMPTGGPNQGRTYTPAPKKKRRKKKTQKVAA